MVDGTCHRHLLLLLVTNFPKNFTGTSRQMDVCLDACLSALSLRFSISAPCVSSLSLFQYGLGVSITIHVYASRNGTKCRVLQSIYTGREFPVFTQRGGTSCVRQNGEPSLLRGRGRRAEGRPRQARSVLSSLCVYLQRLGHVEPCVDKP